MRAYLALPNFFDWFHSDLFLYHASEITRLLNNVRWSIYRYLGPAYAAAFQFTNNIAGYTFNVPAELTDPLAKAMWWDLMNRVRAAPWQSEFAVSPSLQQR